MSSFPVLSSNIIGTLKNWSIKITKLFNDFQNLCKLIEWTEWEPEIVGLGSLVFTVSEQQFSYFRLLDFVFFTGYAAGTTSGSGNPNIQVGLPFPSDGKKYALSAHVQNSGNYAVGQATIGSTKVAMNIQLGNGGNWGIGSSREFRVSGFYKRQI